MATIQPEVTKSTERVYDGRIVKLDVDTVHLPGGGEGRREIIRHIGAAVIVPVDEDSRVALIRQWRYCTGEIILEAPAGTRDGDDEQPLVCAQRELAEETGLTAELWLELGSFYTTPGFTTEKIWAFLARDLRPSTGHEMDPDEQIEVVWMPFEEALAGIAQGQIRDAKTICALHLAAPRLAGVER